MKIKGNAYYDPEKYGLEILDSIDTAGSYEFDMIVVWRKLDDNSLFYATDSGCSCPTPFDDVDLISITSDTFHGFKQAVENHYNIKQEEINSLINIVKDHLKSHEKS